MVADLFDWGPELRYDVVFFSFWLIHVPPARFDGFWQLVERSLLPAGRVFLIRINDGRQYNIVKVYWHPGALQQRLATLGFDMSVRETAHGQCIYGHGAGGQGGR